ETLIEGSSGASETDTYTTDVTTGIQQWSRVGSTYSFVPASDGECSETFTSSMNISGTFAWQVTATPVAQPLAVNPYALYVSQRQAPPVLDPHNALQWPPVSSVAADGLSAVVLFFQSPSADAVTISLASSGVGLGPSGGLAAFDPNYLIKPNPPSGPQLTLTVSPEDADTCAAAGSCTFLALFWGPNIIPTATASSIPFTVNFSQSGGQVGIVNVKVGPPPLLLVHGIWSSPAAAGFTAGSNGFYDFIGTLYQTGLVFPVDYSAWNYKSFSDPNVQVQFLEGLGDALTSAANMGMAARSVDVVAHSMGGLVARYFLSSGGSSVNSALLSNPVHELITIGTPHEGSELAATLAENEQAPPNLGTADGAIVAGICAARGVSPCTLAGMMGAMDKPVDTGVQSLAPGSMPLQALTPASAFSAIEGLAPAGVSMSASEALLDILIGGFLPGSSVSSILSGQPNDTIVPGLSQSPGSSGQIASATVTGVVHTNLCGSVPSPASVCSDVGETQSPGVFTDAFNWLTYPGPPSGDRTNEANAERVRPETVAPSPILNLAGYTQVAASSVTITPATSSMLTIGAPTSITASSSTKTIQELLLIQAGTDPNDTPLMIATQSPFSLTFTPSRLGATSFVAVTVFSDTTYAITPLNYTFQPYGNPVNLTLTNLPVAAMSPGDSRMVRAIAGFGTGTGRTLIAVDVSALATYSSASGSAAVFEAGPGGAITATGSGTDVLNVSYDGLTAAAPISAGACSYSLTPSTQLVPYTGGPITVQVTASAGCAWNVSGGAPWLTLNNTSGVGSGTISLTASANLTGQSQFAGIGVSGASTSFTQPAQLCTYVPSLKAIDAAQAGATGSFTVTTPCPVVVSSSVNWFTANVSGTSVSYTVAANSGPARSTTLLVGTAMLPVNQPAGPGLQVAVAPMGSLYAGQNNAIYKVTVSNELGAAATSGTVAVTEDPMPGLTLVSMSGTGWTCASGGTGCTRGDSLSPGGSYPTITVLMNVAAGDLSSATNRVFAAGGGSAQAVASSTAAVCQESQARAYISEIQTAINQALGLAAPNDQTGSGLVSVVNVQVAIDNAVSSGCAG
ncbi:MAG TPA: BACON domain-containing carbohydrate-binding protein, partial [Bryobacteraceae bacterium]|nr:BACON domain-containing carbohydrate-binding protein [Bryobacteraceae bacterium]